MRRSEKAASNRENCYKSLAGLCICLLFMVVPICLKAQPKPAPSNVDSLTYALYQQQKWDELIVAGRGAIRSGYDYYYMQMRVGIAYYAKSNFRNSVKYFQEALRLNPDDPLALEYLYYALLLGGRQAEAKKLAARLSGKITGSAGISKPGFFEEVYLETGPGFADNQDLKDRKRRGHRADTIYNSSFYYDSYFYTHGGLRINPLPWLSVYQGFSYLSASMNQKLNYQGNPEPDFSETAHQQEYYGNFGLVLPKGFVITPSYHFIWLNYDLRRDEYNPVFDGLTYDTINAQLNSYVLAMSLKRNAGLFAAEVSGSFSHFDHSDVWQIGLFGSVYPLGNLDFYSRTGLLFKSSDFGEDWIFKQLLGASLAKGIWLEMEATSGDLRDFNERNAFVVYNAPEKINFKIEGNIIFEVGQHLELSLRYRYMQRENVYFTYLDYDESTTVSTEYPFHTFIGGIKWRF